LIELVFQTKLERITEPCVLIERKGRATRKSRRRERDHLSPEQASQQGAALLLAIAALARCWPADKKQKRRNNSLNQDADDIRRPVQKKGRPGAPDNRLRTLRKHFEERKNSEVTKRYPAAIGTS
jgi:hypothetical protein